MPEAPLNKLDPTRTITLRRVFGREITSELDKLKAELFESIFTNDSYSLFYSSIATFNTAEEGDKKIKSFREWLSNALSSLLGRTVLGRSLKKAYEKGMSRAYSLINKGKLVLQDLSFLKGTLEEFKRNGASQVNINTLIERTRSELKGLGEALTTQLLRDFSDGITDGDSKKEMEKRFNSSFDKHKRKALLFTGNEIIRSHAWGELDGLKALGVTHVGLVVEFVTAGDSHVCPQCLLHEGMIYPIEEAYGIIPVHLGCRCMFLPVLK